MILVLVYWILIYIIVLSIGDFFIKYFLSNSFEKIEDSIKIIIGLVVIYTTALFWSFFFNISITYFLLLIISSLFFLYKNKFKLPGFKLINVILIFSILLLLSAFSAIETDYYDEGLYYIQWVKWLNSYGIVKGVANLHQRFGFNSSGHILQAVFSLSFGTLKFNDLNGFLLSLVLIDSVNAINLSKKNNNIIAFSLFSFLILFSFGLKTWTSMSVDPTIMIFSIYIVKYFLLSFESNFEYNLSLKILIILCFFIFSLKATAFIFIIPVLLLTIMSVFKRNALLFFFIVKCFFIILAPWIISNVLISGYMFFPFKLFDFFNFEWKVPTEQLWNPKSRLSTIVLENHFNLKFSEIPTLSWLKYWISLLSNYLKSILLLSLFSLIITICYFIKGIQSKSLSPFVIINMFCVIIIVTSLVLYGPNLRYFNFAYCLLLISTFSLLFLKFSLHLYINPVFVKSCFLLIITYNSSDFMYNKIYYKDFLSSHVFIPFQFASTNNKTLFLNGQKYYVSNGTDQCWNSPLPCAVGGEAPFNIYNNKNLSLIDRKIKNGFKVKKRILE